MANKLHIQLNIFIKIAYKYGDVLDIKNNRRTPINDKKNNWLKKLLSIIEYI